MSTPNLTPISELGEFALIDKLTSDFQLKNSSSLIGIGDDAAEINTLGNSSIVSTDLMVEGIHFDLNYFPLKYLGFKLVSISVSDICAMSADAKQLLTGVACSSVFTVEAMEELYSGIHEACEHYGLDLIGGDTTASRAGLLLSSTVLGECTEHKAITRAGAKKGDLICVSGDLGASYMGLLTLEREKQVRIANPQEKPDWQGKDWLLQKFLKPLARTDIIEALRNAEITPSSMIDVSDGLSSELLHICKASKLGCQVYENKLPFHPQTREMAMTYDISATTAALSGGEDYELLFTIDQSDYDQISKSADISVIGHMTEDSKTKNLVTKSGKELALEAQGWNHF